MPPGVLQEARVPGPYFANRHESDPPIGGIYGCDLSIAAFPGDWDIRVEEGEDGYPYYPMTKDLDIIYELQMAVDDEIDGQFQEKIKGIDDYDRDYEEAMDQFEEDYDYEQSLIKEKLMNSKVNLHRLLACPFDKRQGWCGEVGEEPRRVFWGEIQQVCGNGDWTYRKERYRWQVEMINGHPQGKRGYALGKTDYGYVYFPEKFRGYVPEAGSFVDVTVALQDVGGGDKKGNAFRFTTIYTH
jgi:hypothetical protein